MASGTTQSRDLPVAISGLCWFMLRRLPPLLDAFAREADGVRAAEDIEYIHRMRVASRRLRAAIPLFKTCFPKKQYSRWMRTITRITRALGDARDADVQIASLKKYLKKHGAASGSGAECPQGSATGVPAAQYLLIQLENHRQRLQKPVLIALDNLEKSGIIPEMQAAFREREQQAFAYRRIPPLHTVPMVAARRVLQRLESMLSYEPWICHPEAVAEHHATRIAAKKLRYTLEIYGPAYRNGLKKYLIRVKRVQEILGDLHDCDVWIDQVTAIRLKERMRLRTADGISRPGPEVLASLQIFLREKEQERRAIYRQFTRYWARLSTARIWQELRKALVARRRQRFCPPAVFSLDSARPVVEHLAATCPGVEAHRRQVTRLALMLFDHLATLHQLGQKDRILLEYAGLLHDIGWGEPGAGHNQRGAGMILADEHLPLDLTERAIIVLATAYHRGKGTPADDPLFTLLSGEYRQKAMAVSALLRVADNLDISHAGTVREIHCTEELSSVRCEVVASVDCSAEKKRAMEKSDLFVLAFKKPLVIQ